MYDVQTPEVIILDRVKEDPRTAARLDRMLRSATADQVVEVDDAGLAEIVGARGWNRGVRTGEYRMERAPAIIFNTFRWLMPEEFAELEAAHPPLGGPLLGSYAWGFRNAQDSRHGQSCICQSAYEIHCAFGCLHACDYCHVHPYFNIMLNLEELAEKVREFGETIPWQNLYKFDNMTDTICLEPEYGASEVMVNTFADWPGRYLLLYTKSDNVDHLLDLDHRGHTLISWTVSCETVSSEVEKNTPSLENRIRAIEQCQNAGYTVRVRFSPICPLKNWRDENRDMIHRLLAKTKPDVISIDVLGWMDITQMRGAMDLSLFAEEYVAELGRLEADGFRRNGKHVWPHEMRAEILRFVIDEIKACRPEQPVSICMETEDMWNELGPLVGMSPENYVCCCGPTSVPGHELLACEPAA